MRVGAWAAYWSAVKLRGEYALAQGCGAADKKASPRGNAIPPYLRAPGSFKRLLGSDSEVPYCWFRRRKRVFASISIKTRSNSAPAQYDTAANAPTTTMSRAASAFGPR